MARITFKGQPIETAGNLPAVGTKAPAFTLVGTDLGEASLSDYAGKRLILNIFPSIDTPVCLASVRRFNEAAIKEGHTVLCISADLPFAHARSCAAEGLSKVVSLSTFRAPEFGKVYGVTITTGPLKGLLSRAVLALDGQGVVRYAEHVAEIAHEPNYSAIPALK